MAIYKDVEPLEVVAYKGGNKDFDNGVQFILEKLDALPTADVVEVKHGEWELKSEIHHFFDDVDEEFYVECSLCKRTFYVPFELEEEKMLEYARKNYPYCNCGAKMDGRSGE